MRVEKHYQSFVCGWIFNFRPYCSPKSKIMWDFDLLYIWQLEPISSRGRPLDFLDKTWEISNWCHPHCQSMMVLWTFLVINLKISPLTFRSWWMTLRPQKVLLVHMSGHGQFDGWVHYLENRVLSFVLAWINQSHICIPLPFIRPFNHHVGTLWHVISHTSTLFHHCV